MCVSEFVFTLNIKAGTNVSLCHDDVLVGLRKMAAMSFFHLCFPGCHGDALFTRNTPQEICPVKCSADIFMTSSTKRKERLYVIISWTVSPQTSEEVICYILQVTSLKSNGVDDLIICQRK